jgi:arylsulfatase A-like enzyme
MQFSNIETHTPWFVPKGFEGTSTQGAYGDAVHYLDYTVGVLIGYLKKLGIYENTIIVFSSDNGPLVKRYPELEACYGKYATVDEDRQHLLRDGKYQARVEGGPRVACIVRWPGLTQAGTESDQLIGGFDFFTSFLNSLNIPLPSDRAIDGKDIRHILGGDTKAPSPHTVFYGYNGHGMLQSIRKGNWKLAVPSKGHWAAKALETPMLFDLSKDLGETNDLAAQHPKMVARLMQLAEKANTAIKNEKPMPQ